MAAEGAKIFRVMKWTTLFAAICFCLWFLSEVAGAIVWVMQLIEQNPNDTLETMLIYLQNNIAQSLASLSGAIFFFTLCSKQFKKK